MGRYKTEQEEFWAGQFGDEYTDRNAGDRLVAGNIALFASVMAKLERVTSVLEFGANRGLNIQALKCLLPNSQISAVEINPNAVTKLKAIAGINVYEKSILDFEAETQYDLTLSKGLLIHIDPDMLPIAYDAIYKSSKRYICLVEYFNPTPVELEYRGNTNKLFKRDFAGEMLDIYPDLVLLDYGFTYHRDNNFPQDDANWFILCKK